MARLISDELKAFLESGLAIVVGTRDAALRPDGAAALALRVQPDGVHVTLYLSEPSAARLAPSLAQCPRIAVVLDQPSSHRACQIKGEVISTRVATDAERPELDRQREALDRDLESLAIPPAMFSNWQVWPSTALEIRADELFEQTPGPGAGNRLPAAGVP